VLDERKLAVLRAIVEDYVATQEPVGSKTLVDRHALGVSPATVRNDMAALEEEGFIAQPHTSAGRIPTDKGYRLFVDRLANVRPLSTAERRAITTFLDGAVDLDDVVQRSVRMLAQLTRQVAIVQYPSLTRSTVRHVELVQMPPTRMLLVLITSTGRVEQRVVDVGEEAGAELLSDLRARINAACMGERIVDAVSKVADVVQTFEPRERPLVSVVTTALMEAFTDHRSEERIVVGGTANLTRFGDDFDRSIRPMLEALEEHVVLMQLLGQATSPSTLTVRIGSEVPHEELTRTAIVASGYGVDALDPLGNLGVVGPTRMDYPGTMASVRAVARYVSQRLADG
jgi:heat-inducible transcriptional repressor